jgi:signal transduction histidine kinase
VAEVLERDGNTRDTMATLASETTRFCGARQASLYLYHEDGELDAFINAGLSSSMASTVEKLGHTEWVAGYLGSNDYPALLPTLTDSGYPSPLHKVAKSAGFEWLLTVPLMRSSRLRALMLLYFEDDAALSDEHLDTLQIMSGYAALALSSAQLIETRRWEKMAQDQFFNLLNHELRTPLTSILGFAQIIKRRISTVREIDSRMREQLYMLSAQALRLNRLLDTFVDVSSIERGDFTIDHDPIDMVLILKTAVEQSQAQAHTKHQLSLDLPARPTWIQGDQKRLEHVISHLVSNALRYTPEDKPVKISCEEVPVGREVVVSVADRGPGIPAELRREIFKGFYPTDTRKAGGMGIGLYVSRAIVEAHGGRLVLSDTPNGGTTVTLYLPLA